MKKKYYLTSKRNAFDVHFRHKRTKNIQTLSEHQTPAHKSTLTVDFFGDKQDRT